ncbi:MAG: hypothetical protein ACM3PC_14825 [Deltaproteobacteria bacterium]
MGLADWLEAVSPYFTFPIGSETPAQPSSVVAFSEATMAPHAGFAATLAMSEAALQDALRSAYLVGRIPHWLLAATPPELFLSLGASFFIDVPRITLSRARPRSIVIDVTAWGPMTVHVLGKATRPEVVFRARLDVPFKVELRDRGLYIHIGTVDDTPGQPPREITLLSYSFTRFAGDQLSAGLQDLLADESFRALFEQAIRSKFQLDGGLPPIDVRFLDSLLGPVSQDPSVLLSPVGRAVDGALVVGIDVTLLASPTVDVTATTGNPAALSNLLQGLDLVVWVNPSVWIPANGAEFRRRARAAMTDGATLDALDLELHEGFVRAVGRAHISAGSATFSVDVFPRLTRPGRYEDLGPDEDGRPCVVYYPPREALWFEAMNATVDIQLPWWVTAVEIVAGGLTAGLAILWVESFITMVRDNSVAKIQAAAGSSGPNRITTYEPLPPDGPRVTAKIDRLEFHEEGIVMGASLVTDFRGAALRCTSHPSADDSADLVVDAEGMLRGRVPVVFAGRLPYPVMLEDNYLRTRWTVRNLDDNSIVVSSDERAAVHPTLTLTDPGSARLLRISCRVYRALGADTVDFLNDGRRLVLRDRLDRRSPFVRWYHYVRTPEVVVERDGSHSILGERVKYRNSQIHRTDLPGRCRMAARYSLDVPRGFALPPTQPPRLVYLDSLPFPKDRVGDHRGEVCEYCFFGGPTNTAPLPLPGP